MAKRKPVKTVKEVVTEPVKTDDIIITENTKVEIDSFEEPKEMIVMQSDDESVKTVIGLASAEHLQKSGWQLIDCHHTPEGKKYKFKKVSK